MAERARVADGGKVSVSVSQMSEPAGSPDAQVPQRARPRPKVGCWHVAEAMGAGKVRQPPQKALTFKGVIKSALTRRGIPAPESAHGEWFCANVGRICGQPMQAKIIGLRLADSETH